MLASEGKSVLSYEAVRVCVPPQRALYHFVLNLEKYPAGYSDAVCVFVRIVRMIFISFCPDLLGCCVVFVGV